ncbi:MAG: lipoyl(octanoyl) transferase LipB [Solirubrobacteraceae bacterium]|jgi:lipoyl(octanoyl) transferase
MSLANRSSEELWVCHLGTLPYGDALAIQGQIRTQRQANELPDTLLLLEHPPVYTRGRRSGADDLPFGEDFYRAKGVDVVNTDRGGQLTYHGPGQLVGYPIMRIHDVHRYLRMMEDAIIDALADAGVSARSRREEGIDYTGVWVQDRKIASIGVHVSRGVTTHGFAVNVDNDLDPFSWVIACGLPSVTMTSLARESAGECEALSCFRKRAAYAFCQAHDRRQRLVSPQRLGIDTANPSRLAERVPINATQPASVELVPV